MRHIAIQRTSTVDWHTACPYCNSRTVSRHPDILDAMEALTEHIKSCHPRIVMERNHRKAAVNQLLLDIPGSELV